VASVPELMAIMMITDATPIMIPNIVSRERSLFLATLSQATLITSVKCILISVDFLCDNSS
jgi:hypothetical protein